jgi:hypothetical protein
MNSKKQPVSLVPWNTVCKWTLFLILVLTAYAQYIVRRGHL